MPISKGEIFRIRDVFVDYPFEDVMFRWSHNKKIIFRKFYGEMEAVEPISHKNRLYNDALLYGEEISKEEYFKGK
ncbi:hypothetical protein [Marinobacter sp. V034]|uniref:hypothetical protein n=1 Tax=Marinobacter sp. V034 TaxID=3459610 RepID=UPI0040451835